MIDYTTLTATFQRRQQRQGGNITYLADVPLAAPQGQPFMPQSPFQFNQQGGASIYKRYISVIEWSPEIDDAIEAYGLSPFHVVQKGDIMLVPKVPPFSFTIDDADTYPGSHIEVFTLQPPSASPTGPVGGT